MSKKIYDDKTKQIIDLINIEVLGSKSNASPSYGIHIGVPIDFKDEVSIIIDSKFFVYVQDWNNSMWDKNGRIENATNYKRDFFIFDFPIKNNKSLKLHGCSILSYDFIDNKIEINMNYDYSEVNNNFPELTQAIRELKINDLLS